MALWHDTLNFTSCAPLVSGEQGIVQERAAQLIRSARLTPVAAVRKLPRGVVDLRVARMADVHLRERVERLDHVHTAAVEQDG